MSTIRILPAVCVCLFVASCATRPVLVAPPAPVTAVALSVEDVSIQGLDIDSVRIEATVLVSNDGETSIPVGRLDVAMLSGVTVLQAQSVASAGILPSGGRSTHTLVFEFDAPEGESRWIDLRLDAVFTFRAPDGSSRRASTAFDTRFPRILPPVLEIRSITILKDELINTRLGVDLAVHNPNVFPLSFASLDYKLYGEGQYWTSGTLSRAFEVPAGQTTAASLSMTMNFTDMDRRLLDRVIRLAAVSYRLAGNARIDTGLDFLPRFELPFDLGGTTAVLK